MLRARAIETQCYVVAAAQSGVHNEKRSSYGHAMVIDPWGAIIAQCSETTGKAELKILGLWNSDSFYLGLCYAEILPEYIDEVRRNQPVFEHRRSDLYSIITNVEVNFGLHTPFQKKLIPLMKVLMLW